MLYPYPVPRLREHIPDLEHARGTAGGHHGTSRGGYIITLPSSDGRGNIVMLQVETSPAAAAPVGFRHFQEPIARIGREQCPRLRRYPQRFLEMARVVIGNRLYTSLISACEVESRSTPKMSTKNWLMSRAFSATPRSRACSSSERSTAIAGHSFLIVEVQVAQAVTI